MTERDARRRSGLQLLLAFELAIGGGLAYFGAVKFWQETAPQSWPTVPGQVIDAKVTRDSVGFTVGRRTNYANRENRLHVLYVYAVGGVKFTSTVVGMQSRGRNASADAKRYGFGNTVTVHYDPTAPSRAVLDTSRSTSNVVSMIFGALLLGGAVRVSRRLYGRNTPPNS